MLATAFRQGLAAARAGGVRAYALALLAAGPAAAVGATELAGLLPVVFLGQVFVLVALIRLLGAHRPVPVPPPPQVDEQGRRVLPPPRPGPPLSPEDARPFAALRNAGRLWRPVLSLFGLLLLAYVSSVIVVIVLSGGRIEDYDPRVLSLAAVPVSAVFVSFVVLAPHRIALEGETRVLVAAAHALRIAKTAYGPLLLLTIAEPLVGAVLSFLVPEQDPPASLLAGVATLTALLVSAVTVVVTAVSNELYLTGPRLDLPAADPAP